MCNTHQKNHTHAKGYPSGKKNKGRNDGLSVEKVVFVLIGNSNSNSSSNINSNCSSL